MRNITITAPSNSQVLTYSSGIWINQTLPTQFMCYTSVVNFAKN